MSKSTSRTTKPRKKAAASSAKTDTLGSGKPGPTRGRGGTTWPKGPKLAFLDGLKEMFLHDRRKMYTFAVQGFVERWGYDLPVNELPKEGVDYMPPDVNDLPEDEQEEEETRRKDLRHDLRLKIANWARHRWLRRRGTAAIGCVDEVLETLLDISSSQPRKQKKIHCYQKLYYEERVKGSFESHWDTVKDHVGEDGRLAERNKYVGQKWHEESSDFREQVKDMVEGEFKAKMNAWENRKNWTESPASFEDASIQADDTLGSLADAVSKLHGAGCSIFLWGPRADGKISTTGYHSFPGFESRKDLHEFDLQSYSTFVDMLIRFAKTVFTADYCKSRIVNDEEDEESDANTGEPDKPHAPMSNVGVGAEKGAESCASSSERPVDAGDKPSAQEDAGRQLDNAECPVGAGDKPFAQVAPQLPAHPIPSSVQAPSSFPDSTASHVNVVNVNDSVAHSGTNTPLVYNDPLNPYHFGPAGINAHEHSWNLNNNGSYQSIGINYASNTIGNVFGNNKDFGSTSGVYAQPGPAMYPFHDMQQGGSGNTGLMTLPNGGFDFSYPTNMNMNEPDANAVTNPQQLITSVPEANAGSGAAPTQLLSMLKNDDMVPGTPQIVTPSAEADTGMPETDERTPMSSMPVQVAPNVAKPVAQGKENAATGKKTGPRGRKRGGVGKGKDKAEDQGDTQGKGDREDEGNAEPAVVRRTCRENKVPSRVPTTVAVPIDDASKKRRRGN
ncbi:hypothetical protein PQX77_002896 [Marasmius sp. AFHP31]|nr:hypothetical protein PQX77_002896 [Marasmius sp. AFHP31]